MAGQGVDGSLVFARAPPWTSLGPTLSPPWRAPTPPPSSSARAARPLLAGELAGHKEILVQASKVSGVLGGERRPAEAGRRCGRSGSGRGEPLMASSETPSLRPRRSSAGRARGRFVLQLLSGPSTSSGTGWIEGCWGSRPVDEEKYEAF